jgi:hypothetical protein
MREIPVHFWSNQWKSAIWVNFDIEAHIQSGAESIFQADYVKSGAAWELKNMYLAVLFLMHVFIAKAQIHW